MQSVPSLGVFVFLCLTVMGLNAVAMAASERVPGAHMERGAQAFERGHTEAALVSWQEAARLYQQRQEPAKRSVALTHMAQAYEALGFFSQAISSLETARALSTRAGDEVQLARILANLGNLYVAMGPQDVAEQRLKATLALARSRDLQGLEAVILNNLGNLSISSRHPKPNDFEQALQFYSQSVLVSQYTRQISINTRALIHAMMAILILYKTTLYQQENIPKEV